MFKNDRFTFLDWLVFSILIWIPMVNILFIILFAIKKGFLYTFKKVILVFVFGIAITLLAIATLGFN
ncbi:MAG: hypothetical protein KKH92_08945 [Firmicutes bacterium]|nr:hypothetical protein [Bacillota bacterium]